MYKALGRLRNSLCASQKVRTLRRPRRWDTDQNKVDEVVSFRARAQWAETNSGRTFYFHVPTNYIMLPYTELNPFCSAFIVKGQKWHYWWVCKDVFMNDYLQPRTTDAQCENTVSRECEYGVLEITSDTKVSSHESNYLF